MAIEELGAVQSMSVSITDDTECDELIGEENNDISKNCSEDLFKSMDFLNWDFKFWKFLELKQRHWLSQSAPTILVYQVGLIFFQDLELEKRSRIWNTKSRLQKNLNYTLARDTLVSVTLVVDILATFSCFLWGTKGWIKFHRGDHEGKFDKKIDPFFSKMWWLLF